MHLLSQILFIFLMCIFCSMPASANEAIGEAVQKEIPAVL